MERKISFTKLFAIVCLFSLFATGLMAAAPGNTELLLEKLRTRMQEQKGTQQNAISGKHGLPAIRKAMVPRKNVPTSVISGMVLDEFAAPIAGAKVYVIDSQYQFVGFAFTDPNTGEYSADVPDGDGYYVFAVAAGYSDEMYDDLFCENISCSVFDATPVPSSSSGINFALTQNVEALTTIIGRVTNSNGSGIPFLPVIFQDVNDSYIQETFTDIFGNYQVDDVRNGTYLGITLAEPDYFSQLYDHIPCPYLQCDPSGYTPLEASPGQILTNIDFSLTQSGAVEGTIALSAPGTLPESTIAVSGDDVFLSVLGQSDPDGHFRVNGLVSGNYYVYVLPQGNFIGELYNNIHCYQGMCDQSLGTKVPVTEGNTTAGVNFSLETGGTITGAVTNAQNSSPVPDFTVLVFDEFGNEMAAAGPEDPESHYRVEGLPTGNYHIATVNSDELVDELYDNKPCPGLSCEITEGTLVDVTAGSERAGINFALSPGGYIQGSVLIDSVPGVAFGQVAFYDSNNSIVGYADAFPDFQSPALPPGTYHVKSWFESSGIIDELYDNIPCPASTCNFSAGDNVVVNAGAQTSFIDFDLASCGGSASIDMIDIAPGTQNVSYNESILATGNGTLTFAITSGSLPPGLSMSAAGVISGTPTAAGDFRFSVGLVDSLSCSASANLMIRIAPALCLFCDEFEDGTLSDQWTYLNGAWSEDGHNLVGTFKKKAMALATPAFAGCQDCSVETTVKTNGGLLSVFGWYVDKKNSVELMMKDKANRWLLKYRHEGKLVKAKFLQNIDPNVDYTIKISFNSGTFQVDINGASAITLPVTTTPAAGTVGFQIKKATGTFGRINVN